MPPRNPMKKDEVFKKVWGLTGGIGSGKSTLGKLFESMGALRVAADSIARCLSRPGGEAHTEIVKTWGNLDRATLRELILHKPEERKKLESILHPWIIKKSAELFRTALQSPAPPRVLIYEAALLVETGRAEAFAGLIVVTAPESVRIDRVLKRNPDWTSEQIQTVLKTQLPDTSKISVAKYVIDNSGDLKQLERDAQSLWGKITSTLSMTDHEAES